MNKEIKLTEDEAKVVLQALDLAIRQGGAQSAVIVLPIMQKIDKELNG